MAKLPVEAGIDARLLAYGGAHPFIHLVDVAAGTDAPMPSPADEGDDAVDGLLRRAGYFAFSQTHAMVALPSDLSGDWAAVPGRWGPIPARDPSLMWVLPPSRDSAALIDRRGGVHRHVELHGPAMLRAELDQGLVVEDDHGNMRLLDFEGGVAPWHDLMIADAVEGAVVGAERHGRALVRLDLSGNETGRVSLEEGWRWSSRGSLSPSGRYYLDQAIEDIPFEEVLKGARLERRLLFGDLDTGAVVEVDTAGQSTGYHIWDRTGQRIFLTTFTDLATFTVDDPRLRRASPARIEAAPLMDVTDDLEAFPRTLPRRLVDLRRPVWVPTNEAGPARDPASPFEGTAVEADSAHLTAMARPGIRMVAGYGGGPRSGRRSRLGGRPSTPSGHTWPRADGQPLLFIGQVDFRDVRGLPGAEDLPSDGLLAIWFDARENPVWGFDPADREHWYIAYFQQGRLGDAEPPDDLPDEAHTVPQPLSFEAEVTFPPVDLVAGRLAWTASQQNAYDDAVSPNAGPFHRLLGHPDPVQSGDMATEAMLAANGIPTAADLSSGQQELRAELLAAGEPWRLLVQIDSDSGVALDWCGGGRLYVWIRENDLRERRFDDCWIVLQTD